MIFVLAAVATAQIKSSVSGQTFRNENIGLTWTFPETFIAEAPDKLPRDPTGRDQFILALWNKHRKTPVPPVVFLWDTKITPSTLSPFVTAQRYLQSLKPGEGFKLSKPTELSISGFTALRMNYSRPDDAGQSYNSAIAVPLRDRTLLFIQMNALSQHELDSLVDSLRALRFEAK